MTLRDLLRLVNRYTNKGTNPPNAETQERIRAFLNARQRDVLTEFPTLRDEVLTFSSVASQQDYAFPEQGIARILRIWETTNDTFLEKTSAHWIRTNDPDPQEATSTKWADLSGTQVHTQPSNASEIFIKSTSASDVNRAYIEGLITNGYRRTAEVTMTGTTAVSLDTSITTWIEIDKVYLSEPAVGTVTLHEDSGSGTELSRIAIGDTYAKYITVLLWPTPSSAITYSMDVTRAINDMVNPLDEPLLPVDFHQMLAVGARLDEYEHTDDPARRRIAEVEWDRWMKKLTSWVVTHPSVRIDLNTELGAIGGSRLGSWFPTGS